MTDVNVWLALIAEGHIHHQAAQRWFSSLGEQEAVFCRIAQMGFLRLLTSPAVLKNGVMRPKQAWITYQSLREDARVAFAPEPAGLESGWIALMSGAPSPSAWTDAYLAAFALGHGYTLVSFDRGFQRWKHLPLRLLG